MIILSVRIKVAIVKVSSAPEATPTTLLLVELPASASSTEASLVWHTGVRIEPTTLGNRIVVILEAASLHLVLIVEHYLGHPLLLLLMNLRVMLLLKLNWLLISGRHVRLLIRLRLHERLRLGLWIELLGNRWLLLRRNALLMKRWRVHLRTYSLILGMNLI